MEMVPLLDISLGLFLAIFGFILERLGRSQMKGEDGESNWQIPLFGFLTVIAGTAALVSGVVYTLGRETQFLTQTVVSLFVAIAGALNFRRARSATMQPPRYSFRYFNDALLWFAGIVMGIAGAIMVVTFPARAVSSVDDFITTFRTIVQVVGIIAGFSAIGFMLLSLLSADS
jgi:hypothetical protein